MGPGSKVKQREVEVKVTVDLAMLPGPPGFLGGPWVQVHDEGIIGADVAVWPYSFSILCTFNSFLG